MADEKNFSAKDEQAHDRQQKDAPIKDLPQHDVSKDAAEQVKGGKSWNIPEGTASPSA